MPEMMELKSSLKCSHFQPKALVFLFVITIVGCLVYLEVTSNISNQITISKNFTSNGKRSAKTGYSGKIIIAFNYWEQLSMATNNLLHLAAFAAHGGRQVVVPFVKDSGFRGTAGSSGFKTLALYFNVTALNDTLRSRGHATFISWEGFQDVCKGRLDVLVHFDYTDLNHSTTYSLANPFVSCMKDHQSNKFRRFKVGTTICINVFALDSVDKFEREVVKRRPCVGISEWRGSSAKKNRAKFDLSSIVENVMSYNDIGGFFNSKLIHIAQEFIAHNLGLDFISVHIRTEHILKTGGKLSLIKLCISRLRTQVQSIIHASTVPIPVFVATDFNEFGSSSRRIKQSRENAKSLMEILHPLRPITFQPAEYKLLDRGAVAIVEMNILASGKHLTLLGGGSFQTWVRNQFLKRNSNDQSRWKHLACREMQSAII